MKLSCPTITLWHYGTIHLCPYGIDFSVPVLYVPIIPQGNTHPTIVWDTLKGILYRYDIVYKCTTILLPHITAALQVLLRRTTEIAMIGFEVQDLTTELNRLKASSQQSQRPSQNDTAGGSSTTSPASIPAVKVVTDAVTCLSTITH